MHVKRSVHASMPTLPELPDLVERIGDSRPAAGNSAGVLCYVASLQARLRGRHFRGVLDALAGATLTAGAGYLGGHLALNQGLAARRPTQPDVEHAKHVEPTATSAT